MRPSILDPRACRTNLLISFAVLALLSSVGGANSAHYSGPKVALTKAVIVHPAGQASSAATAELLQYEIEKRTGIALSRRTAMPSDDVPAIVLGSAKAYPTSAQFPPGLACPGEAESYAIWVDKTSRSAPTIYLVGRDDRGALFAAGRLIILLNLSAKHIALPENIRIASAPDTTIRAHQILSSTQCEDGFVDWDDLAQKHQHIRDMVLFGTNGFEPRPADDVDDYMEKLGIDLFGKIKCDELIDYAKLSDDEIRNLYTNLVGVDHFTTYGGDASGSRPPMEFFPTLDRILPLILESHPGAKN